MQTGMDACISEALFSRESCNKVLKVKKEKGTDFIETNKKKKKNASDGSLNVNN